MTIKNIKDYQLKKKKEQDNKLNKRIVEDLEVVLKTLKLTLDALGHYSKYVSVQQVLSCVQTNKTLLEIHLKKVRTELEK